MATKNINAEKIQGNLSITSVSATTYYNLPTSGGSFTGGTVSGPTNFTGGLTANTISATTYYNLPTDIRVTGGTFSNTTGTATFRNNTGGTFNVSGFTTGLTTSDYVCQGYLSTNQSLPSNVDTVIQFIDDFDPQSWWNSSTYRFTPTVAGYYNVTLQVFWQTSTVANNQYNSQIRKNGNQIYIWQNQTTTNAGVSQGNTKIVYFNGTTDYVEFTGYNGDPTSRNLEGGSNRSTSYFSASLIAGSVISGGTGGSTFTGGTVTGPTVFTEGLTANTISATTYYNLPTDIRVTGGTYSGGTAIFTNNTGGTFSVTGFTDGGSTFTGGTVSGETNFTGGLTANTISATTYYNLPTDINVTGGTYSTGTTVFTNNTGGTFNVSGYYTGVTKSGDILFVSPYGDDSTGVKGYIDKPFLTLKGARDAASSGDTIHVFPQTFIFDNRNSNSNYWNSRIDDLNLWKNGVSYYFEPNCKIKFYNQTVTGAAMSLFRPRGDVFEICSVFGFLEYEQYGIGADSSNGQMFLINGSTVSSIDSGYTFDIQLKSIYNTSNEAISLTRGTSINGKATVTINADTYNHVYTAGQSGTGSSIYVNADANNKLEYSQNIRYVYSQIVMSYYFRGDFSNSLFNIVGDILIVPTNLVFQIRPTSEISSSYLNGQGVINVNIKKIHFYGPPQNIGAILHNVNSSSIPFVFNLKGDCIEYSNGGNAKTLFFISGTNTANRVINYEGNIYTITALGETTQSLYSQGRRIAYVSGTGSTFNFKGDINYNGSLVTLREAFKTAYNGVINYTGNIKGNFGCPIAHCNTGEINIYNSSIISEIDSTSSSVMSNPYNYINSDGGLTGNFETGKVKISNSYISLKNSNNYIGDGGYLNAIITNSTIINSGTDGYGVKNVAPYYAIPITNPPTSSSTPNGKFQLLNTTIITSGTSINYVDSTTPVISSNSTTNSTYNINTLYGDISTITEITF